MALASPLDTLFLPFSNGQLTWADKTVFIGARLHPDLGPAYLWQIFKPFSDELVTGGFVSSADLPQQKDFALALCLVPKQVEEAKYWLALALERLENGGTIMAAAANDAGGSRLQKWFEEAGITDIQSESKNKSRVVWGKKSRAAPELWIKNGTARAQDFDGGLQLQTQPGLFSWDRIDPASRLLAANFPPAMSGHIADFGCGYGYLSVMAVQNPKVTRLTLVEADRRALDCAVHNLQGKDVVPLWHNAIKPLPVTDLFDSIIMNPPFHTGKKTDVDLGIGFIRTATANLKRGGSLTLVANTHLPYEAALESVLKNVKLVVQKEGFKILRAVK